MKKIKSMFPAFLLGISFFLAVFFVKPIGVSTQFSILAGVIENKVNPGLVFKDETSKSGYASTNAYLNKKGGSYAKKVAHPINYGMVFVISIAGGALLGSVIDPRKKKLREKNKKIADELINNHFIQENLKENKSGYIKSFLAGFLFLFGARLAGGCTSGHMMSGIMQSSISGFIFAATVFAVAVPFAMFLHSNRGGKL